MKTMRSMWEQSFWQLNAETGSDSVRVAPISRKPQRKWLVDRIKANPAQPSRDPELHSCIENFLDRVQRTSVAITHSNSFQPLFGKQTVISLFVECFGDLYNVRIRDRYLGELGPRQDLRSLREVFNEGDRCDAVAKSFLKTMARLDRICESDPHAEASVAIDGDALEKLAWILEAIYDNLERSKNHWCEFCFRRAAPKSDYCKLHSPGQTQYVRVKRNQLNGYDQTRFMRSIRALGHNDQKVRLVSSASDTDRIEAGDISFIVQPEIKDLVSTLESGNWEAIRNSLLEVVSELPLTAEKLEAVKIAESTGWDDFLARLRTGIDNPDETNRRAFWVLAELYAAEEWAEIQAKVQDGRRTETADKILKLDATGMEIPAIAKRVNVTPGRVYEVLRESNPEKAKK